jgi:hypothetical protein
VSILQSTAATASLVTLPHDEDADERSTQGAAYDHIALQRGTCLLISVLGRSLRPRNRFDENENSRARLGCQSSGIVLGVQVGLQQIGAASTTRHIHNTPLPQ